MIQGILATVLPLLTMLLANNQATITSQNLINPQILSETSKQQTVWVVRNKDTLTSIAGNYYGNQKLAAIILKDNPWIENPNIIEKGWKIKLRQRVLEPNDLSEATALKEENTKLILAYNAYKVKPTVININMPVGIPNENTNYEDLYKEAGEKFGVPWQVLYGLHLTETGQRDGTVYNKQGSGARGPMQFMPGTFKAYAVDGNGDGKTNIDDAKDAVYTAANYLAKHGSVYNGLKSYGGNTAGTLAAARSKGLNL